jgi:transketolase
MSLSSTRQTELNKLCKQFRVDLIEILHKIQTGHPGGSLSAVEILVTLYYEKMNHDPKNPQDPKRDRFILSKGHAAPMLYLILAECGYFPKEELATLRQLNSRLQGHPCANDTPGVELSTGPLGLGISAGVGMAAITKLNRTGEYTYVLLGDGEMQEGIVWEAAQAANKFGLDHLIVILDHNGVQLDGTVAEIMPAGNIADKWRAFGWHVIETQGHNIQAIAGAIDQAKSVKDNPVIIIAETVKGKGISFMEGKNTWHGKAINDEEYVNALHELGVE